MEKTLLRLPLGISDFPEIREGDYAYVDKTRTIEKLEKAASPYVLFLRPRRFGKTLLTSMLLAYYDEAFSGRFDQVFGGTYIHAHRTPLQGKYWVLRLDFSGIDASNLVPGFISRLLRGIQPFFARHRIDGAEDFLKREYGDPARLISDFFRLIGPFVGRRLFVVVDEYDHFANDVLANDKALFKRMTSAEGFLKTFYAALKAETGPDGVIARIFATGVTSISMDSMTSGFNIQINISQDSGFCDAVGFTGFELLALIEKTVDLERIGHRPEEVVDRMREYYNGYRFSPDSESRVYNPAMCLYYLSSLRRRGKEPVLMVDPTSAPDLSKIGGIFDLAYHQDLVDIVDAAMTGKSSELPLGAISPAVNLNSAERFSRNDLLSVLFFMGYLTYSAEAYNELVCPNKAIRLQFFEYYFEKLKGFHLHFSGASLLKAFEAMRSGDIVPFLRVFERKLQESSGIHAVTHLSESSLQFGIRYALLTNSDYQVSMETEARGKGYSDVFLEPLQNSGVEFAYLLELKYIKKSASSPKTIQNLREEAAQQLHRYAAAEPFASKKRLKKVAVVFCGLELVLVEEV